MLNLIGLILAFIVVIILVGRRLNFSISLIIGSLIVFSFSSFEASPYIILKSILKSTIYSIDDHRWEFTTLKLAITVLMIIVLARSMEDVGTLEKLMGSLRKIFSSKSLIAITPAVIGLLHVPGGALFSAPLIDEEGEKLRISKESKAIFNVWFRHIWFLISPLSTSIILISSRDFADINIYSLILVQIPTFFIMTIMGFFMMRKIKNVRLGEKKEMSDGLKYLIPIVIPILLSLSLSLLLSIDSISALLLSLPFGIGSLFIIEKRSMKETVSIVGRNLSWNLPLAIFAIMIFRGVVVSSGVIGSIRSMINASGIPTILIIVMIPFLLAFFMGYNLGAIALSFPIVEPLFGLISNNIVVLTSILYVSSFVGYLISPLHLCVVVTNEYFKPDIMRFYRSIILPSFILVFIHTSLMLMLI